MGWGLARSEAGLLEGDKNVIALWIDAINVLVFQAVFHRSLKDHLFYKCEVWIWCPFFEKKPSLVSLDVFHMAWGLLISADGP